jgi:excisionase family DNA binding protein
LARVDARISGERRASWEVGVERERLTLSVEEAAAVLGISRALTYELVARGELPCLRLGRRIVVPRRALLALVEAADTSPA